MKQKNNGLKSWSWLLVALLWCWPLAAQAFDISYLYNLSDFTGTIPYSGAQLALDDLRQETYVAAGDAVQIFNANGMEVYRFEYDPTGGNIYDAAVESSGDVILLTVQNNTPHLLRCSYRGEPQSEIVLSGLPPEYLPFIPNRLILRDDRFYLASLAAMRIAVVGKDGSFISGYDLVKRLDLKEDERADTGIGALTLDGGGNLLFTLPTMGRVGKLSTEGDLSLFGRRGSAPGRFGVPAGISTDQKGNIFVTDRLRCVVLVFAPDFNFIKEFGFRGLKPGNLIGPNALTIDRQDRVYVTQLRNRGVSVYQASYN